MKKILIILLIVIFISLCAQKEQPPTGGGGGGGGGPPSCSASFSLTSTGKDTCIITSTITANYCDNKSYELKNGETECSGTISGNSFSKECSWIVSVGDYNYYLYVDGNLKDSGPIVCKSSSKCSDDTLYDSCSVIKPLYCSNGNLINKCSFCGCPESQLCNATIETCYSTCSEGTPYGSCSIIKPKFCDDGNLINKCPVCGCPSGQNCNTTTNNCYIPSSCSGSVSLDLNPSIVEPGGSVIPSTSGLSNCNNKIIYFKNNSCIGTQLSACTITNGGCTGSNFTSPSNEGLYTYYACIDKNGDGDFTDSGESSSKILNVSDSTLPLLQSEIVHIDNSLEYLRASELGVHDMAEYVISKNFLGTQIPNKTQIINYFDSAQRTDGSWSDAWTPMFTTYRVLTAYNIMNATPNRSLDAFFSKYDTWSEALTYISSETKTDLRDIYHITLAWTLYYQSYPSWLNDYFNLAEQDLSWTNSTNAHKRTHIVYNYVIARRSFPNLDGIINETLREQSSDGHWDYQCLTPPRPVYCNAIQLALLQEIIKLHPNHRTTEIQSSIDRSRVWLYNT